MRLVAYQGRTSFLSMMSGPLESSEFSFLESVPPTHDEAWGHRMVADEATKAHVTRLIDIIGLCDGLVIDQVCTFCFPTLRLANERYFIQSWEWQRFVRLHSASTLLRLAALPTSLVQNTARRFFRHLYDVKPDLRVALHFARPCFNDRVRFDDEAMVHEVDHYLAFCDELYSLLASEFHGMEIVAPPSLGADPDHPNGPHPFNFPPEYHRRLEQDLLRVFRVA